MNLGDRIKRYELSYRHFATIRTPLMIRVDGRAFHTFTRGMEKPFDNVLMKSMMLAALAVAKDMQGFKAAYVQSDEVTFCLTDYDSLETTGWFGYNTEKIISISASLMSVNLHKFYPHKTPIFDSRCFSVPVNDVVNAFLWRAKDWERNSLQMYCHANFSHEQLHKKNISDMHEMLHNIGKNWTTDLSYQERNGTFIINDPNRGDDIELRCDIVPRYNSIDFAIGHLFKYKE